MRILAAQPASKHVLYLYGDFESNAPGKLAHLKGIKNAYLVPQVRAGRRCLVVEPTAPIAPKQAPELVKLVRTISKQLWSVPTRIKLVRAVERPDAGQPAATVYDWARLR